MESQEEGVPGNLRKQLAVAVRRIQWSYAIFWSSSATQHGVLEWHDGYYNGDIKTRKTVQAGELKPDKIGLQRSEQLRELYESLLEGEPDPQTKRPSAALSPEDLTNEEWYYFVCMSFVFNTGEGLPGRTLANNQTIWLCNAQYADSKVFSRSLLAKSASIQTVVCFPFLGGVIELGVTDLVTEDHSLLQQIKLSLLDFSKPLCSENSSHDNGDDREHPMFMKADVKIVDTLVFDNLYSPSEEIGLDQEKRSCLDEKELDMDSPDDCSIGCDHNHQTEDSFKVDHPNGGGASQVQSWHFADDDLSNGIQGSINSSDCISEEIANHNNPGLSPEHENAKCLHLKHLEECNHSKLSCLDIGDDDFSHYKRTISSILKNSDRAPNSLSMCCCIRKFSFVPWRVLEVHRPLVQQEMLKKALFKVPLLHCASVMKLRQENQSSQKMVDSNCSRGHDLATKIEEQDKFLVLRSMIPSIEKIDKASILDDTILYLKELEARVEELESCKESTVLEVRRNRRKFPDMVEKTSNHSPNGNKRWMNKRKASDMDGPTDPELGKIIMSDGLTSEIKINKKDREVVIAMKCPYREYMLVDILEAINNLQLDTYSVQSSTMDGILSLTLRSKFRGAAVSPVGMIKQSLWKITGLKVVQDTIPTCVTTDMEEFLISNDGGYSNSPSSVDRSARGTPGSFGEPSPMHWPSIKSGRYNPAILTGLGLGGKQQKHCLDENADSLEAVDMELEMMKERFSKLLLGEDMSGSGKGVCTAVTISNAITNLYATVFGHNLRLEPRKPEKKAMWKREMNCLLLVCDYIVEFVPTLQALPDGTLVEAMSSRPRSDICINLPALRKLDAILLEILDSFQETEFWYAEHGSMSGNSSHSGSFRRIVQRKDEKWWLPVPCVNPGGLSEKSRKHLHQKRDRANQIHKAAMAINGTVLDEMEMPDSYLTSLPKSGRAKVGDVIYRYMILSDRFSADHLLDCLGAMSEHEALDLADRVEAAMYTWRRKACITHSKSSWTMVKDFMAETGRTDKKYTLAERAEGLLLSLKQKYPELSQTSLDTSKIQFNKDVGQAILESHSRVLEGLAFNIVAWIEDVLHVDKTMRNSD